MRNNNVQGSWGHPGKPEWEKEEQEETWEESETCIKVARVYEIFVLYVALDINKQIKNRRTRPHW